MVLDVRSLSLIACIQNISPNSCFSLPLPHVAQRWFKKQHSDVLPMSPQHTLVQTYLMTTITTVTFVLMGNLIFEAFAYIYKLVGGCECFQYLQLTIDSISIFYFGRFSLLFMIFYYNDSWTAAKNLGKLLCFTPNSFALHDLSLEMPNI